MPNISNALPIKGWMREPELIWLAERAAEHKRIVEFGSFHGRSTRALADNTSGIVYAVDPWNGRYFNNDGSLANWINTDVYDDFCANLADHIQVGKVRPVKSYSINFNLESPADFIFIDGDHRFIPVLEDIKKALSLLKPNGLLAGHDYNEVMWPGVKQAVDSYFEHVNLIDSIWWIQKS